VAAVPSNIRLAGRPDFAFFRLIRGCGVRLMRVR
jgi:hypothetical protein